MGDGQHPLPRLDWARADVCFPAVGADGSAKLCLEQKQGHEDTMVTRGCDDGGGGLHMEATAQGLRPGPGTGRETAMEIPVHLIQLPSI